MPITKIPAKMIKSRGSPEDSIVTVENATLRASTPTETDISEIKAGHYDPSLGVLTITHFNEKIVKIVGFHTSDKIPVGPTGPQGIAGRDGKEGKDGRDGAVGTEGCAGTQGLIGQTGPVGETGRAGDQGIQGPTGPQGEQGPQGAIGPQGPQGAVGPQGPRGEPGVRGKPGPQGPEGYMNIIVSTSKPAQELQVEGLLWIDPSADYDCTYTPPRSIVSVQTKVAPPIVCPEGQTVGGIRDGATTITGTFSETLWSDGVIERTVYDYAGLTCAIVPRYIVSETEKESPVITCPEGQTVGGIRDGDTTIEGTYIETLWSDGVIETSAHDYGDAVCEVVPRYIVSITEKASPPITCPVGQTVGGVYGAATTITGTYTETVWSDGVVNTSPNDYGDLVCEIVPAPVTMYSEGEYFRFIFEHKYPSGEIVSISAGYVLSGVSYGVTVPYSMYSHLLVNNKVTMDAILTDGTFRTFFNRDNKANGLYWNGIEKDTTSFYISSRSMYVDTIKFELISES